MKITSLTINNQNLKLVYDFNVLCDCEGPTNRNLLVALARQGSNSASELRGLLFALTRVKHPKLTLEQCGALVNIQSLAAIQLAVMEACAAAVSQEFLEQWKEQMEANDPDVQVLGDSVRDVDDDDEPQAPRGEHVASFEDYRSGKTELSQDELYHAMKCEVCMPLLNEANRERITVVN